MKQLLSSVLLLLSVSFADAALGNAVILSWSPNATNELVTSYQVYQSSTVNSNFIKVATTPGTSVTCAASPGIYFWYVTASNSFWGESSPSATVQSPASPTAIMNITMAKAGTSSVQLSWPANDPSQQIVTYNVYTSASKSGPFTPVGSTPGTTLNEVVTPGVSYFYVTASNFWGETDPGTIVSTPAVPSRVNNVTIKRQ